MSITRATEVERKYDVDESAHIPDLSSLGVAQTVQPVTLWSTFYDTADGALAEHLMTLRRRTGDGHDGWHLTTPAVYGRTEFHAELADDLPPELADRVRSVIRDHKLVQVARVSTRRSVIRLLDKDSAAVADIADDVVLAIEVAAGTQRAWREWEVELRDAAPVDHDAREALLDSIEDVLRAAGATPSGSVSKLAHATGRASLGHETMAVTKSSTSLEVVVAILTELVAALVAADPRARDDEPDAVHAMRVITRRLRGALAAFRSVLDRAVTDGIRVRLRELSSVLGEARNAEVRRQLALELLDDVALDHGARRRMEQLRPDVDLRRRLVDDALGEYRVRHEEVVEYLDSTDYLRLLDDLDDLIARPPIMPNAVKDARHELRDALRRQLRRTRKRLARAREGDPASIHEARKAARRLRYVAESLSEGSGAVFGKKTRSIAAAGHEVQSASGDHRDAVLYINRLDETARAAAESGEDTAGYDTLAEAERRVARAAFGRFTAVAKKLRRLPR
jgi:CHAD domain-containing protein